MAKTPAAALRQRENVVASLDALDSVTATVAKSTKALRSRLEELEDALEAEREQTRAREMEHAKTVQDLETRLSMAESKIRKVADYVT